MFFKRMPLPKTHLQLMTISYSIYLKKNRNQEAQLIQTLYLQFENDNNDNIKKQSEWNKICNSQETKTRKGSQQELKQNWELMVRKVENFFVIDTSEIIQKKLIQKLILNDQTEVCDMKVILDEQNIYYANIYSTSNPIFGCNHRRLFI